jgi:hypothetical protein
MSVTILTPAAPVLTLTARYSGRTVTETFPTESAAWDARDRHIDAGGGHNPSSINTLSSSLRNSHVSGRW